MMKLVALVLLLAACNTPPPAAPTTGSPATPQPATAAPTTTSATNGQLIEIRIGITGNTADAPLFIAQDRGYFKEQGLKLTYTRVQSANDVVAPLGAGQLEVGGHRQWQ